MSARLDTSDDVGLRRGRWLQRRLPALLLAVIVVAGLVGAWRAFAQRRVLIEEGKWIGWTEKQLVARVDSPTKSSNEYVCVGRESPPALPAGPHRTLYYETKRGHLYIWLHRTNGTWVCFDSLWFAEGVQLCGRKQARIGQPLCCPRNWRISASSARFIPSSPTQHTSWPAARRSAATSLSII